MKAITKNLLYFSIAFAILTVLFRFFVSSLWQDQLFVWLIILPFLYGGLAFVMGWYIGKKDRETLPMYDVGFRFHLATYLVCNVIAELWFALNLASEYEDVIDVHRTAIIWGFVILIHLIVFLKTRKNAIKGIKKSDIFE